MLTMKNNSTGEIVKISHDNKEGLKLAKDILYKWFFAFNNVIITNETESASQFD